MEDRKRFVAGGNLLQAHTWKGMLEAYGLQVELRGEALLGGIGELPTDLQTVELWVSEKHLEEANSQLALMNVESPRWKCVQCHELNEGSFELCWQCSAERSESHN